MRGTTAKVRQIPTARSSLSPQAENNAICPNECRVPVRQFFNIVPSCKVEPRETDTISRHIRAFITFLTYCFVSAVRCFYSGFQLLLGPKNKRYWVHAATPRHTGRIFVLLVTQKIVMRFYRISLRDSERTIKCQ